MSKDKNIKDTTNEIIPNVKDKRDKNNKDTSITISNYETLDKIADKDKIDKYIKEHEDALHNPFYSIDLNTKKVKQNEQVSFIVDIKKPIHNISDDKDLDNYLHNEYLDQMKRFNNTLDEYLDKKYDNADDLDNDIVNFNNYYDNRYYNGFNLRVKNYLDDDIKQKYINKYADAVASLQLKEITDNIDNIIDFADADLDKDIFIAIIDKIHLKDLQEIIKDKYNLDDTDINKDDINLCIYDYVKQYIYTEQLELLDASIEENQDYYKKINKLYKNINDKIIKITNNFKSASEQLNTASTKYDVIKFISNNDISAKIDPIAKTLLNGSTYKADEIIKPTNNYNDKTYSAVFSIKTSNLSNIDIIEELKENGIKINHFDKKIIDDIDLLIDENKGNVTNNDLVVALTPKMITRKVYNKEQPTKKQIEEISDRINRLKNIYLLFVKDHKTADAISKLRILKDKGIEILQDKEGNILNIGDTLDDNLIINAKEGYSQKYGCWVYALPINKSTFYRINQLINKETNKQLLISTKDDADRIFNDYNKNVNDRVVGIRYLLYERVNQIRHNMIHSGTNKEILLSKIYEEFDIVSNASDKDIIQENKQKQTIRNIIKNVLNYWVDINYINGYKFLDINGNEIQKNSTKEIYKIYLDVR